MIYTVKLEKDFRMVKFKLAEFKGGIDQYALLKSENGYF